MFPNTFVHKHQPQPKRRQSQARLNFEYFSHRFSRGFQLSQLREMRSKTTHGKAGMYFGLTRMLPRHGGTKSVKIRAVPPENAALN
jgi:hypothetical protein